VRVGVVCPYSLTVPGGVQGQVIALGGALRAIGIDARVLGPCDGPPPDGSVTPLGKSVPFANNGSMAPIAPDPACTLRTIRALRDEDFDLVHLHEPLVPGPSLTALVFTDAPMVGTFHRSGETALYRSMRPMARWAARSAPVHSPAMVGRSWVVTAPMERSGYRAGGSGSNHSSRVERMSRRAISSRT